MRHDVRLVHHTQPPFAKHTPVPVCPASAPHTKHRSPAMDGDDASSSKLASFLALAKSARGLAACSVVAEATAAPGVFAFGELLDMPHMQEVCAHVFHRVCAPSSP